MKLESVYCTLQRPICYQVFSLVFTLFVCKQYKCPRRLLYTITIIVITSTTHLLLHIYYYIYILTSLYINNIILAGLSHNIIYIYISIYLPIYLRLQYIYLYIIYYYNIFGSLFFTPPQTIFCDNRFFRRPMLVILILIKTV